MVIEQRPESKDRDQIGHFGLLYSTTYNSQTDSLTEARVVVRHGYLVSML